MSNHGGAHGKGDAMWRALSVARGRPRHVHRRRHQRFQARARLRHSRPDPGGARDHLRQGRLQASLQELRDRGAGRRREVTELSAKPLFNLFYPELTGFVQPLAGSSSPTGSCSPPSRFLTGYAVETGIMIDVLKVVGLEAMAQVDLGTHQNRHQPLRDLPHGLLHPSRGRRAHAPGGTPEPGAGPWHA